LLQIDSILHLRPSLRQNSSRAHDKILRVARTIAGLDGAPNVTVAHLAEAVQDRRLNRNLFA